NRRFAYGRSCGRPSCSPAGMTKLPRLFWRGLAGFIIAMALTPLVQRPLLEAHAAQQAAVTGDPTGATTGTAKDVAVKDAKNPSFPRVWAAAGNTRSGSNSYGRWSAVSSLWFCMAAFGWWG